MLPECSGVVNVVKTHFDGKDLQFVEIPEQADVAVSSNIPSLVKFAKEKKFLGHLLLWTNEPRWNSNTETFVINSGYKIFIMNGFSGDIFVDHFHYLWVGKYKQIELLTEQEYDERYNGNYKELVCLASQHGDGNAFLINGVDCDLYALRRAIALYANSIKQCDIYGAGWPEGIISDESECGRLTHNSWGSWEDKKLLLLQSGRFNLAFENTVYKNYITEKFWHPIMAKVLPVTYEGDSGISTVFPEGTFVNYCDFESPEELMKFLSKMSKSEYIERINKTIAIYNNLMTDSTILKNSRLNMAKEFVGKVYNIVKKAI
jgi:hypothetical protein